MTKNEALSSRLAQPSQCTVRGVYVDAGAGGDADMPWHFTYRPPGAWRIEYTTGGENKLITDGTSTWIIDDGVAVVAAGPGKPLISHKLRRLVEHPVEIIATAQGNPHAEIQWDDLPISEAKIGGRSVWIVAFDESTLSIDQDSGVALRWSSNDREITLDNLEVDPPLPPTFFRWSGPEDAGRRPGIAYVAENDPDQPAGFTVHWEVYLRGKFVYCEYGPRDAIEGTLAWARQRARQIEIRTANNLRYSAGDEPPRGELFPRWPE